jgi:hypothetical protein
MSKAPVAWGGFWLERGDFRSDNFPFCVVFGKFVNWRRRERSRLRQSAGNDRPDALLPVSERATWETLACGVDADDPSGEGTWTPQENQCRGFVQGFPGVFDQGQGKSERRP